MGKIRQVKREVPISPSLVATSYLRGTIFATVGEGQSSKGAVTLVALPSSESIIYGSFSLLSLVFTSNPSLRPRSGVTKALPLTSYSFAVLTTHLANSKLQLGYLCFQVLRNILCTSSGKAHIPQRASTPVCSMCAMIIYW